MKKGPLSKAEKKYIETNYQGTSVSNMAGDLNRSEHMVEKHVMKMKFESVEVVADETVDEGAGGGRADEVPVEPPASRLMARNTERGVVIMTKEASMAGDESKANRKEAANGTSSKRMSRFIHVIKER